MTLKIMHSLFSKSSQYWAYLCEAIGLRRNAHLSTTITIIYIECLIFATLSHTFGQHAKFLVIFLIFFFSSNWNFDQPLTRIWLNQNKEWKENSWARLFNWCTLMRMYSIHSLPVQCVGITITLIHTESKWSLTTVNVRPASLDVFFRSDLHFTCIAITSRNGVQHKMGMDGAFDFHSIFIKNFFALFFSLIPMFRCLLFAQRTLHISF